MPTFSTSYRLKQVMNERNLKQVDILRLAKPYCETYNVRLGRNDLSQYISGKVVPKQDKTYILAKALDVSEAWLMGYDIPRERMDTTINQYDNVIPIKTKKVPLLGDIACGEPILCNQEYDLYIDVAEDIQADFCVRAKGDSMINARIFNGDIVFCKQQPTVENGEIAVVIIDDEATLKRVYQYKNRIELRAENPIVKPIEFEGEDLQKVRILGKAIAFQSMIM